MSEIQPSIFDSRGALAALSPDQISVLTPDRKKRYADVSVAALANTAAEDELTAARKSVKAAEKALVRAGAEMLHLRPIKSFASALKEARDAFNNANRR
jgi:hypothetical protein